MTTIISEQPTDTDWEGADEPTAKKDKKKKNYPRWPVLVLAGSAFVAIWGGWVALGEMCGYGVVNLLPGIADFKVNLAITLPLGMEVYAAYALGAWLTTREITTSARSFAKWSALMSLAVGGAGQISYHLLAAAGISHAPWQIVVIVACVPVGVLGMASYLAHRLHVPAVKAVELPRIPAVQPMHHPGSVAVLDLPSHEHDVPEPQFAHPATVSAVAPSAAAAAVPSATVAAPPVPRPAPAVVDTVDDEILSDELVAEDLVEDVVAEDLDTDEVDADGSASEDVAADEADDDTASDDDDQSEDSATPAARPRTPVSEEERQRIVQLAKEGYTDRAISREVRRSRHTVSRIVADARLDEELLTLA